MFETNGYGLTPKNLDLFKEAGIDSFWLDIKAYDDRVHKRLTGAFNKWVLRLPKEIVERDFVLGVLSLYIPGWVQTDQIGKVAELLTQVDSTIPFTVLVFFLEHKLTSVPSPNFQQMIEAYHAARDAGPKKCQAGKYRKICSDRKGI